EGGVAITVTGTQSVPQAGGSVYLVTIAVDPTAALGDRSVLASAPSMPATNQAAIGLLTIVAASPKAKPAATAPKPAAAPAAKKAPLGAAKANARRGRA